MVRRLLTLISLLLLVQVMFAGNPEFHGVFVGIKNYSNPAFNLQYPDVDATRMRDYMSTHQHWQPFHMQVLLNSNATKTAIGTAIGNMPRVDGGDDWQGYVDMFFFSGHGNDPDNYLVIPGSPLGLITYDLVGINAPELFGYFAQGGREAYSRYCVFLDACFSGMFPVRSSKGVVCSSCYESEVSCEDPDRQQGLHTYYLLQGLKNSAAAGSDGIVSAEDLYWYARQPTIDRAASRYNIASHPDMADSWSGELNFKLTDDQPPNAPQNVTLTGSIGQHPTIHWDANPEADLNSYKLYRKVTPFESTYSLVATLGNLATSFTDNGIIRKSVGTTGPWAQYYLKAVDNASNYSDASSTVSTGCENPAKTIAEEGNRPALFQLFEAYPNPFNPTTTIRYALPQAGFVTLAVYNTVGQKVAQLASGQKEGGYYETKWDGSTQASGIYYARLIITDALGKVLYGKTNKLLLAK